MFGSINVLTPTKKKEASVTSHREIIATKKPKTKKALPLFDAKLIETFENNHKKLTIVLEALLSSARAKKYAELPAMLDIFSSACSSHFTLEEDRLYSYMKTFATNKNKTEEKVLSEFHSEMKNISISIFCTITQSSNIPVNDESVEGFISEFSDMGKLLDERIRREENIIYPMYQKTCQVVDIC